MEVKTIFNGIKGICCFDLILFRWKINEGYANLMQTKLVYLFFILMLLLNIPNGYSQIIIEQGTVKANFGVDADIYSDVTTFTNPVWPNPQNTDDWFKLNGGTGKGVIDVTSASALSQIQNLQTDPNASAELRMAYPYFSVVDGRYWIDAVYLRDQQTSGNYKDGNVFSGQSNKNFDNPNTWVIGLGDVPQKNDIIDVFGHLRRDGTDILLNPEWGFVGLSTRNDNGDSYIDIEYFRKKIEVGGSGIVSTATDGGRTAWQFTNTGMPTQLGDIIISLDFSNGGVGVTGKIYIWMRLDDKNTAYFDNFNTLPDRPFRFVKAGNSYVNYSGGDGAGGFGYARIELKNIGDPTAIFSAINAGANVDAPSWGTINSSGDIASTYAPIIFYEFGFNLTALGFDSSATQVGCISPFGSVIVKTRSSDSFTAELKDIAGPIELGADLEVDVAIDGDTLIDCTETTTTLTATALPATNNFVYQWYFNGNAIQGATTNTLVVSEAGNYTVEATIVLGSIQGCTASNSVDITVVPPVPIQLNCPSNVQMPSCSSQADINSQFEAWYNSFTATGGTNLQTQIIVTDAQGNTVILGDPIVGPSKCGGIYNVSVQVSDDCNQSDQCSGTFTVLPDDELPVIVDSGDIDLQGCNTPWPVEVTTSWRDNCGVNGETSGTLYGVAGDVVTNGCTQ
ncbi:hypothetical protein NHF50_02480 [Flavobacterium sp. NRK F10]|uniref:hypothetical protein n=1 Tax=Flavobacterium sp. NRK F10 TaxID=2954931 RepID=UPI002090DD93|nr:hypothetical protein [Flavobacterium sp. NRK F10]MCO6173907.1 hypothetical protein [Flavobacterium sp. NRK F10]